ncbi:MAG: MoxR family ATPase [Oscillospiraceae bacterium]|nr:MoxR family ATPase [Oscillospiraceae bacterium]
MAKEKIIASAAHSISIAQAAKELENICISYLEKAPSGEFIIPVNRQRPVMLIGPAGIGKTDIPRQTAEKLGLGFVSYSITHHTRQSALGLPKLVTKTYGGEPVSVTEYTASEIVASVRDEIERTGNPNGILFIDEVNCASESLSAPMLQLFQNKTLGQSMIPEGWILIMAGNPPEYNKSVKEFDAVTRDRLRVINVVPDSKAWLDYAAKRSLNPIVTAYITTNEQALYTFDESTSSVVTPRGWEELSITIDSYEKNNFPISAELVEQYISVPSEADDFYNYYRLVKDTISEEEIDLIIDGKADKSIIKKLTGCNISVRFMLIECMKRKLHKTAVSGNNTGVNESMNNILDFVEKLYGKNGEIEIFMSGILSDSDIVKAIVIMGNSRFSKYLDEITTADSQIKKKMKKVASAS